MVFTGGSLLSFFLLLLLFQTLIHETLAQPSSSNTGIDIPLGSVLSADAGDSWLSPSGHFSFGFYPKGNEFLVGIQIIVNSKPNMVVWTARLDLNPFSKSSTLTFTADGFILNPGRDPQFVLFKLPSPASTAAMLDNGNFVIYGTNSTLANPSNHSSQNCGMFVKCSLNTTNIIWMSFDFPTDTIVGGQSLPCHHNLTSAIADNDDSSSIKGYTLTMQCVGNLVIYYANSGSPTWSSDTYGYGFNKLVLDVAGRLYLSDNLGTIHDISEYIPQSTNAHVIYAAKLEHDIFRLHAIDVDNGINTQVNDVPYYKNKCSNPESCGVNNICKLANDDAKCECPPGFSYIDATTKSVGCQRNGTLPRCRNATEGALNVTMKKMDNVVFPNAPPYLIFAATTGDECNTMCLDDCNCYVTIFRDNRCSKIGLPLLGGRFDADDQGATFIKMVGAGSNHTGTPKPRVRVGAVTVSAFISAIICLVVTLSCGWTYWLLYGRFREQWQKWELAFSEEIAPRYFDYDELMNGIAKSRIQLGKGAHGTVFRVKLPMGGSYVAVKVLHGTERDAEKDFRTEMSLIGRARHANLVPLLGFCHDGRSRLLVYDYMSRNSLAEYIFESQTHQHEWRRRVKLLLGAARGIHYLHCECETKIIHRDIKPENILISADWTAKISDFGLAKFVIASQPNAATRTAAVGTEGYIAPECQHGHETSGTVVFTEKADVYSYGVVVLETVCGRRNRDEDLRELARKCYDDGEVWTMVGGELVVPSELERVVKIGKEEVNESEIERVVKIGILCVQEDQDVRPSMEDVVMMLEGDIDVPNPPPLLSPENRASLLGDSYI